MSTIRENLLSQQEEVEKEVNTALVNLPDPCVIRRTEKDKIGNEIETNDFVSYSADGDKIKIYCKSRSIEFSGKDFDWIFKALAKIGTEIEEFSVKFFDGNEIVSEEKILCGDAFSEARLPYPKNPETFLGWYTDSEFTQEFIPGLKILNNTSVFAKRTSEGDNNDYT